MNIKEKSALEREKIIYTFFLRYIIQIEIWYLSDNFDLIPCKKWLCHWLPYGGACQSAVSLFSTLHKKDYGKVNIQHFAVNIHVWNQTAIRLC